MDYEKLYKEAIERARVWKEKSGMPKNKQGILDDIFPELCESEDDRIRKALIEYFDDMNKADSWVNGFHPRNILVWLEKQGQKPAWSEKDKKEYKYVLRFIGDILNRSANNKEYDRSQRCLNWIASLKEKIGL